jgi:hypothetical protein
MLAINCVFATHFCEKRLAKHHLCMMERKSDDLHSLDVKWVKWLFMENSPDKGNTDTFRSCSSSHKGSGISFHSSQCANFSKTSSYVSRHSFLDICWLGRFGLFKLILYLHKVSNPSLAHCVCMNVFVCMCAYMSVWKLSPDILDPNAAYGPNIWIQNFFSVENSL